MNNIDWYIVIKLKRFSEHLSNKDLIELTMCSKKSRKLLTRDAFNTFNLLSFTSSKDYSNVIFKENTDSYSKKFDTFVSPYKPLTRKLTNSKKEFSNDLKLFNICPTRLVVNNYRSYHYLLDEIPTIFSNIKTLVLYDNEFTLDVLQSFLDNLKCLENLELTSNLILHNPKISNNYDINYPISLKSLKLRNNGIVTIQGKSGSVSNDRYAVEAKIHQHIPNLTNLDHFMMFSAPGDKEELFEFMRLNPQLKSLKLSGDVFYFEVFDIIKNNENLTHLKLDCVINTYDLREYKMPALPNLKYLHLVCIDEDYSSFLMYKLHNVAELVFDFDADYTRKIKWFIEQLVKLKSLKFIFRREFNYAKKLSINDLPNLENIEINFEYKKGRFDPINFILKSCKKLKLITFIKNPSCTPFENSEANQSHFNNWDYLYFPHKLAYHKMSK